MTTQTLRNGDGKDLAIKPGESIQIVAVTGSYTASIIAGVGTPSVIATDATGGNYGPYATGSVIRLRSSPLSEVDFEIGTAPAVISDTPVMASKNLTGGIELTAGGQPVSTGAVGYSPRPLNTSGITNFAGNSTWSSGASGVRTTHAKIEAEAEFSAVRVWVGMRANAGTAPLFKALVGVSDTAAINTVSNAYLPIRSGVAYNALQDTSGRGWKEVTWAGAADTTCPFAPFATNSAGYASSDWIPINSVPRSDVAGARPVVVFRVAQATAGVPLSTLLNASTILPLWQSGAGSPEYRLWVSGVQATDGVATLTNIPVDLTQSAMLCWLEFKYDAPARNVLLIGDSTHECTGTSERGFNNWARLALGELSTPVKPISLGNIAGSGHGQGQFNSLLDNALAAGARPTDVIYQGWSQNGFTATAAGVQTYIGEMLKRIEALRAIGCRVWLTTGYAVNGYPASTNALRNQVNYKVRAWAAAGIVELIDNDLVISVDDGDGTSSIRAEYDSGDGVHSNSLGLRAIADALKAAWN